MKGSLFYILIQIKVSRLLFNYVYYFILQHLLSGISNTTNGGL